MIFGAHVIVYSKDPTADRAFFRDVLGFSFVDAGHDWLIFALPPAELALHPAEGDEGHELYFMSDDLNADIAALADKDVRCSGVEEVRWGSVSTIRLPGGGDIRLYQPKHPSPLGPPGA
jgi:catechol 2,3-dioxygenase-like lactoylglutathione lyase family enzyme